MLLKTERLIIKKVTLKDAPFFVELMNTPSWLTNIGDRQIHSVNDAKLYLKNGTLRSYKENGFGFYKLISTQNNLLIGTCGFIKRDQLEYVDIGFALLPKYEGLGYGYEASNALLNFAKENLGIRTVLGITIPKNIKSINLLKKLGLIFQKNITPFEDGIELMLFKKNL